MLLRNLRTGDIFEVETLDGFAVDKNVEGKIYTASEPLEIDDTYISLKYDNQTLQKNASGQLAVNLNEIGSELVDKANTDLSNLSADGLAKLANPNEKYGIRGDYSTQYGILECPNGILTVDGMQVTLKQGVVMQCAGQDIKTTITGDLKYTITSNEDIDLFYAGGTLLECGEVYYSEDEPENGTSNYIAWWKPSIGKWQFKSNDTGNVYRQIISCRLAHVHTDGTTITRVDYIGNRILDDEIFAEKKDLPSMNELMLDTSETVTLLAEKATRAEIITKINEVIASLQNRGVFQ